MDRPLLLRRYLVSLTLCICALAGLVYLLRVLPPVDQEGIKSLTMLEGITSREQLVETLSRMSDDGLIVNYLNWRNVIINTLLLCVAVFSGFVLVHSLIDRFFISKFYKDPSLPKALRRALFVSLCVLATIFFHLYNASWYLFVSIYGFVLIIEVLITQAQRPPTPITELPSAPAVPAGPENFLLVEDPGK